MFVFGGIGHLPLNPDSFVKGYISPVDGEVMIMIGVSGSHGNMALFKTKMQISQVFGVGPTDFQPFPENGVIL